jgi:hypothetical protein
MAVLLSGLIFKLVLQVDYHRPLASNFYTLLIEKEFLMRTYKAILSKLCIAMFILVAAPYLYAQESDCAKEHLFKTVDEAIMKAQECATERAIKNLADAQEYIDLEYLSTIDVAGVQTCNRVNSGRKEYFKMANVVVYAGNQVGYVNHHLIRNYGWDICSRYGRALASSPPWYKYEVSCPFPFEYDENDQRCITYCPEEEPDFDVVTGQCVGETDVEDEAEMCAFNPVQIRTGEKIQLERDIEISAPFPLVLSRTYRSLRAGESRKLTNRAFNALSSQAIASEPHESSGRFVKIVQPENYSYPIIRLPTDQGTSRMHESFKSAGQHNWSFSLLGELSTPQQRNVVSVSFGGNQEYFDQDASGHYIGRELTQSRLSFDESDKELQWAYTTEDEITIFFNSWGRIAKQIDRSGNSIFYSWSDDGNPANKIVEIFDQSSNSLLIKFGFEERVDQVIASNGITLDYSYDYFGNISSVTRSAIIGEETLELTKEYHYENLDFPYMLTGMTDETGVRISTWEYDNLGRVVKTFRAGNTDTGTLIFQGDDITTTNALGKSTTYHYGLVSGRKRLISVEGHQSQHCAAANRNYTYYPNGQVKTQTDWEGNVTYFEYNDKQQETKRVEGHGSPAAIETLTTWHPTLNLPIAISTGNSQQSFEYDASGRLVKEIASELSNSNP